MTPALIDVVCVNCSASMCLISSPAYPDDSAAEIAAAGASHVTTSAADTMHYLQTWMAALDTQQKVDVKENETAPSGTASANRVAV